MTLNGGWFSDWSVLLNFGNNAITTGLVSVKFNKCVGQIGMATEFDPYRDLLDVRCKERPPSHYALLGLELFESDCAKIDEVAGERMAMLQEMANSKYVDASQKLLNEVSGARRCLLDPTKKIAYDEVLRARQRRTLSSSSARSSNAGGRSGKGRGGQPGLPIGVVVVVLALAGAWFLSSGRSSTSGNLIVEWPLDERKGAAVYVDGKQVSVSDFDPLYLDIPTGRHQVMFQRLGYNNIPKTIDFGRQTVRIRLAWVPSGSLP